MTYPSSTRREILTTASAAVALGMIPFGSSSATDQQSRQQYPSDFPSEGPIPWIKRMFHLYTGEDELTRIQELELSPPTSGDFARLLRRTADRVTIGGSAAGSGFDFHVANQPTLLIPIFGSVLIGLHDGSFHELSHGDIGFAEDCTGKGHISRFGENGCFMVSVQLPKSRCPAAGPSDIARIWTD